VVGGPFDFPYEVDRQGRLFLINQVGPRITSLTDLHGRVPESLQGVALVWYAINEIRAMSANAELLPRGRSYRNPGRCLLAYKNETTPPHQSWWYVPSQGRVLGYDKGLKYILGSFGPDGFVPPGGQPGGRFHGPVVQRSLGYDASAGDSLVFSAGAYTVDFHRGVVHPVFVPPPGERVRWASKQADRREHWRMSFVGTDQAIHFLDHTGKELLAVPLAYDLATDQPNLVGRLVNPDRYWIFFIPQWYLPLHTLAARSEAKVVVYDGAGRECQPRQESLPRPGLTRVTPVKYSNMLVEPSLCQALSGLATSPVEAAALVGTISHLEAGTRKDPSEVPLLLQHLWFSTQAYLPGVRWHARAHPGLALGFAASMLLASACSALACFLLSRRHAFARSRRLGWALCGLLFGPTGLLLMMALVDWPAQIVCPECRKPRVVTREDCEHCGAAQAAPVPDGTEIMESSATDPSTVPIGR
jgi:hypothetical protein